MSPIKPGSVSVTAHEKTLRQLRCVVSGTDQRIELHHCHSGSLRFEFPKFAQLLRGGGQKTNPFFQIPINFEFHRGKWDPEAIGIYTWEEMWGRQVDHLHTVSDLIGYDVFEHAQAWVNKV